MKRLLLLLTLGLTSVFGLEFGSVGPQAFGMAGTGVAVKNNTFNAYFNPSLLAMQNSYFKIGVNGTIGQSNKNFHLLSKIDYNEASIVQFLKLVDLMKTSYINIDSNIAASASFNGPIGALGLGTYVLVKAQGKGNIKQIAVNNFVPGQNIPFSTEFKLKSYMLAEVPVTYAYEFDLDDYGSLALGVTGKLMTFSSVQNTFSLDQNTTTQNVLKDSIKTKIDLDNKQYSFDLGLAYEYKIFRAGIVGKYLNAPKFKLSENEVFKIDPQVRAGVAMDIDIFTLALDYDITKNTKLLYPSVKEQLLSMGAIVDVYFAAVRAGISFDTLNNYEKTYALGVSLGIFDLGFQWGDEFVTIGKYYVPENWKVNLGIGFSI